jgi:nucleotide-binding universal stress UspA family protein
MKSSLVHMDASPRAAARLTLAQHLASRHGADLQAIYGVTPSMMASAWMAGDGIGAAASALAEVDRDLRDRSRAVFDKVAASGGSLAWLDGGSAPYWSLMRHALYADLVVLGQPDPHDALTGPLPPDLVPSAIIDGGKPTWVVPYAGSFGSLARRALIAWKPAREAARAVAAALPWLRETSEVHIATRPEAEDGDFDHAAALAHWLQRHGVAATIRSHSLGPGDVGEALLSLAADHGAEILVMGCYGHSRAREWVLGGATRSVIRSMTLPVLMAH